MRRASIVRRLGAGALALALVLGTTSLGLAQEGAVESTTQSPLARAEFERGRALYRQGRFGDAAVAFQRAYTIEPAPGLLLNIAIALNRLGNLRGARIHLDRFMLDARPESRYEAERRRAEALRAEILQRSPTRAVIDTVPPGARVFVDSVRLGSLGTTPFETDLAVGAHTIFLDLDGYAPEERQVTVAAGEEVRIGLSLVRAAGRMALRDAPAGAVLRIDGRPAPFRADEPFALSVGRHTIELSARGRLTLAQEVQVRENRIVELTVDLGSARSYRTAAWILAGAAVVLGAVGTYFGLQASAQARSVEAAIQSGMQVEWTPDLQAVESEGQLDQWLAIGGWSGAGLALVAAAVLYLAEPRHAPGARERVVRASSVHVAANGIEWVF